MSYREVTMLEIKEVLRLWCAGVAKKRIAVQRGLDIKTVRRHLREARKCGVWPAGEGPLDEAAGRCRGGRPATRLGPTARRGLGGVRQGDRFAAPAGRCRPITPSAVG